MCGMWIFSGNFDNCVKDDNDFFYKIVTQDFGRIENR